MDEFLSVLTFWSLIWIINQKTSFNCLIYYICMNINTKKTKPNLIKTTTSCSMKTPIGKATKTSDFKSFLITRLRIKKEGNCLKKSSKEPLILNSLWVRFLKNTLLLKKEFLSTQRTKSSKPPIIKTKPTKTKLLFCYLPNSRSFSLIFKKFLWAKPKSNFSRLKKPIYKSLAKNAN